MDKTSRPVFTKSEVEYEPKSTSPSKLLKFFSRYIEAADPPSECPPIYHPSTSGYNSNNPSAAAVSRIAKLKGISTRVHNMPFEASSFISGS